MGCVKLSSCGARAVGTANDCPRHAEPPGSGTALIKPGVVGTGQRRRDGRRCRLNGRRPKPAHGRGLPFQELLLEPIGSLLLAQTLLLESHRLGVVSGS